MNIKMSETYHLIKSTLDKNPDISFQDFLAQLKLTKGQYLMVIRYDIHKPTVFLKQRPKDCFINNYNEDVFTLMRSNMDIQFILEPFGCLNYIVNYIDKSNRGVSEMMRKTL